MFDYIDQELLEQFHFNLFTDDALERLGIDSKAQRMDSSPSASLRTCFVGSFIKQMSRLELAVKVLQNFYHDLPEAEQTR